MLTRESGVTLIDMAIGVAIVVVVLGVAYPGLKVANDTIATGGARDRLERSGDKLMKSFQEELRAGLVTTHSTKPPSVTMVRPDRAVRLADIPDDGSTPWGTISRTLRFSQTGTITEAAEGEDINADGDRNDSFAVGIIEVEENGQVRPLQQRAQVILGLPNNDEDLDGDGQKDPLIVVALREIELNIHLIGRDSQGHWLRTGVRCKLHLRNIQQ